MQPKRKLKLATTVRQMSFCSKQSIFLIIGYGTVQIFDVDIENPIQSVYFQSSVRSAGLSNCGKYFYALDIEYVLYIYDTKTATLLQKVNGIPSSTKSVKFSENFSRMLYGSSQMICLWDLRRNCALMRTQHWKNINCYDMHKNGRQFAIGTYNGAVYLMDFIGQGKCNQVQIKKHKSCIMSICFHKNQILSLSYDGTLIFATLEESPQGKLLKYTQMNLKSPPKRVQSVGDNFYMFDRAGMSWFNKYQSLVGFTDHKSYSAIINQEDELVFIKQGLGQLQWWPGTIFKTKDQIIKDQQKQKQNKRVVYVYRNKS